MLLKLLKYYVNIMYKPGSEMDAADTLSRAFVTAGLKERDLLELHAHSVMEYYPASAKKISEYKVSTSKDETLQKILTYLQTS